MNAWWDSVEPFREGRRGGAGVRVRRCIDACSVEGRVKVGGAAVHGVAMGAAGWR
jgi:hypothetical protein